MRRRQWRPTEILNDLSKRTGSRYGSETRSWAISYKFRGQRGLQTHSRQPARITYPHIVLHCLPIELKVSVPIAINMIAGVSQQQEK